MPEPMRRSVRITSPPGDVNLVHEFLADVWAEASGVTDVDRMSLETALIELSANVIRHADASGSGLSCEVTITVDDDAVIVELRDTGEPGDIELTGLSMPALDAESGRGLALIDALVDELTYERVGEHNVWRLTKRLDG